MSERVVPTKPGLWFCRHIESHGLPDSVVTVREPTVEDDDHGTLSGGLVAEFSDTDELLDVWNVNGTWLAPVPSVEAVSAVQSKWNDLCQKLEAAGWHPSDVEDLNNAIAGLTGGEGL